MPEPISTAIIAGGAIVAGETLKLTVTELLKYLGSKASQFKNLEIDHQQLFNKGMNVENVKTIWQVDKAVNLNEFYYPSVIKSKGGQTNIDSLSVIPSNASIVIEGTAGQGKSILLRYLAGKSLQDGTCIPLFIELRKVSERKNLETLILGSLEELGVSIKASMLEHIFSSEKFTLLLDAFDEIPAECVSDTLSYLEQIGSQFRNLRIVISSRPHSGVQVVPIFQVYYLKPIARKDFRQILQKLCPKDKSMIDGMVCSLESNRDISSLITTPLLLTLLTITYKSDGRVPDSPVEFYQRLFHLMVLRHDATKPGFRRKFTSELNEYDLEKLFQAFCFQCMVEKCVSLSKDAAYRMVNSASKFIQIKPYGEPQFLNDCIKNTCLLVEEGHEYHFIHKSIREFHAAKFVAHSQNELKDKFYSAAVLNHSLYREELMYLSEIDKSYFDEKFYLPLLERFKSQFIFVDEKRVMDFSVNPEDKVGFKVSKGDCLFSSLQVSGSSVYGGIFNTNFEICKNKESSSWMKGLYKTIADFLETEQAKYLSLGFNEDGDGDGDSDVIILALPELLKQSQFVNLFSDFSLIIEEKLDDKIASLKQVRSDKNELIEAFQF